MMPPSLPCSLAAALLVLSACGGDHVGGRPAGATAPSYAWRELFDGGSLSGWRRLDFEGTGGQVSVRGGAIVFGRGDPFTGIVIDAPGFTPPADEYEIVARAMKTDGRDFFCALTFPVPEKGSHLTFVAGGWGGGVTGLSNLDHLDANRNTTRAVVDYKTDEWYELRIEIRRGLIRCFVNGGIVTNAIISDRHVSLRPGAIEACAPFGLASWETAAEFESIRIRALPPE